MRARRNPEDVSILAVTKTVGLDEIKSLLDLGLTDLAESRAPQLAERASEVADYLQRRRNELPRPVRWHMVGHLQRNKVSMTLKWADRIHSVDSLRLAEEIQTRAAKLDKTISCFLQVNCSEEPQKHGIAVGAAFHLGEMMATMPNLRLAGLMTMGPLTDSVEESRYAFSRLREIFEEMRKEKIGGKHFRHLSMGMSSDFIPAVEQGATILRIGSALFA